MRVIEVLERSWFGVNPLGGKFVYMDGGMFPREREIILREEADPKIPYPLLNPLQTAFELFYEGGSAVVMAPTSAGNLFMRRHKGKMVLGTGRDGYPMYPVWFWMRCIIFVPSGLLDPQTPKSPRGHPRGCPAQTQVACPLETLPNAISINAFAFEKVRVFSFRA